MGAFKKGMHLRQCFYVTVIHDGIHPSIMNRNRAMAVSFRVGNTAPAQYHFVLEEAISCLVFWVQFGEAMLHCMDRGRDSLMQTTQKKRFSVSLDMEDYIELQRIADAQKSALSLQYPVSYALNEFIDTHKNKQVEFDFERKKQS